MLSEGLNWNLHSCKKTDQCLGLGSLKCRHPKFHSPPVLHWQQDRTQVGASRMFSLSCICRHWLGPFLPFLALIPHTKNQSPSEAGLSGSQA